MIIVDVSISGSNAVGRRGEEENVSVVCIFYVK
jgi:hypothetical protein